MILSISNSKAETSGIVKPAYNPNNDYAAKNAFYKIDKQNISTVGGYLTFNTWYRPKMILRNGQKWEKSTKHDRRPILMAWWPSKRLETQYINFMNEYFDYGDDTYDITSSQSDLNAATQVIQKEIEMRITQTKSTKWLKAIIQEFIQDQSQYSLVNRDEKSNKLVDGKHRKFNINDLKRLNSLF
ncbi:glycoside hydrolase family 70 protein [Apilactobacillus sp. EABW-1NA]|uniref:glycoside hydrolase family 70 protein n=1 Tax=Apilactobacillus sp. EABW-1NA TaxID=2984137 RepID=UPI000A4F3B9C|nr:glycoside hydrolase family 70 protein [Apilactobacillus sp. EABW-1NA]MDN2613152.1 hypothetical protein [Apilactobacillus sp. EABW-1NA]